MSKIRSLSEELSNDLAHHRHIIEAEIARQLSRQLDRSSLRISSSLYGRTVAVEHEYPTADRSNVYEVALELPKFYAADDDDFSDPIIRNHLVPGRYEVKHDQSVPRKVIIGVFRECEETLPVDTLVRLTFVNNVYWIEPVFRLVEGIAETAASAPTITGSGDSREMNTWNTFDLRVWSCKTHETDEGEYPELKAEGELLSIRNSLKDVDVEIGASVVAILKPTGVWVPVTVTC